MINAILAEPLLVAALPTPAGNGSPRQMPPNADLMLQAYRIFHNFDWRWLLGFAAVALFLIGIVFFGAMFFKRQHSPKLGFFLYVVWVGAVRTLRPDDKAWLAAAVVGIAIALILLFSTFAAKGAWRHVNRKEPIYYLMNAFALCMFTMPLNQFEYSIAAFAVFSSLFFITASAPRSKHKYKKRDADPAILESLEKRANKKFGRD